jgi:hypothetical protein
MIEKLLAVVRSDFEARTLLTLAYRAGELTPEQVERLAYANGIEVSEIVESVAA